MSPHPESTDPQYLRVKRVCWLALLIAVAAALNVFWSTPR
jgi:hypothetical protein